MKSFTTIAIGLTLLSIAGAQDKLDPAYVGTAFEVALTKPSMKRRYALSIDLTPYLRKDAEHKFVKDSVQLWRSESGRPRTLDNSWLESVWEDPDEPRVVVFFVPGAEPHFRKGSKNRLYIEFSTDGAEGRIRRIVSDAGGPIGRQFPADPFATFEIDAKLKSDHVLSRRLQLVPGGDPIVLSEDKRDVWQFDVDLGLDSIGNLGVANAYFRTKSKVSQFQIDPESKLRFSIGLERAGLLFGGGYGKKEQTVGKPDRSFLEWSYEANQALKNQQWVATLGHVWSSLEGANRLFGQTAIDYTAKLNKSRNLYGSRLRTEAIWKHELPFKLFGVARDSTYVFAEGKAWYTIDRQFSEFNGFGQRLRRLETWGAYGIAIPISGPINGDHTHLKIYYRSGASPNNLYEKQVGVNFELAVKF